MGIVEAIMAVSITAHVHSVIKPDVLPLPATAERPVPAVMQPGTMLPKEPTRTLKPSQRYGIDVSHYQGLIDWHAVSKDSRVRFAYLKATESSSLVDDTYERNFEAAKKNGVLVGSYHFFSPTSAPQQQLANFLSKVNTHEQDLIPLVDVERISKNSSVSDFIQRLKIFIRGVENAYGCKPMIYTGQNFYNRYLSGHFKGYKFMFARYTEDHPLIDDDDIHFVLWQFSAAGTVNGIRGKVDRSCFMGRYSIADLRYRK